MEVAIARVPYADKTLLRNLMNLYIYDFSEYLGRAIGEHGFFEYPYLDHYWTEGDDRVPFLIRADGEIAGFVLVNDHTKIESRPARTIAEFFVLRKFRRQGVGEQAARLAFDLFPGPWEVSEIPQNLGAQVFWRRIIDRYTGGQWQEQIIEERVVQTFDNSRPA